jgi:hypothetical protein
MTMHPRMGERPIVIFVLLNSTTKAGKLRRALRILHTNHTNHTHRSHIMHTDTHRYIPSHHAIFRNVIFASMGEQHKTQAAAHAATVPGWPGPGVHAGTGYSALPAAVAASRRLPTGPSRTGVRPGLARTSPGLVRHGPSRASPGQSGSAGRLPGASWSDSERGNAPQQGPNPTRMPDPARIGSGPLERAAGRSTAGRIGGLRFL